MSPAEQGRINGLIAKASRKGDTGLAEMVTILEGNGVRIKNVNHDIGSPLREVDIELANGAIIQIKKLSSAQAITKQLAATERATGRVVVGYIVATHKKAVQIVNNVNKGPYFATHNIDDLLLLFK